MPAQPPPIVVRRAELRDAEALCATMAAPRAQAGTLREYALRDGVFVDAHTMARLRSAGSVAPGGAARRGERKATKTARKR